MVDYGADGTAVSAVADLGYHFVGWSDGGSTRPAHRHQRQANITVTASFAINTYTLTSSTAGNGSIDRPASRPSTTAPSRHSPWPPRSATTSSR